MVGEVEDPEPFGRAAELVQVGHDEGLGVDELHEMRVGDVGRIERRVLAQQHDVLAGEVLGAGVARE